MSSFPPPGYFGLLKELFKNSSFLYVLAFVRKMNLLILIPVFAITAAFIQGITDSGWLTQLIDFLQYHLGVLHSYTYRCSRALPDVMKFFNCFE